MSCFSVTSFSPFSGGRSHSSDTARLWLDEEDCSCFLAFARACSPARYSLPSSPVLHASCPCTCPSDWLGDDCQSRHFLDNNGFGPYFFLKPVVTYVLFNVSERTWVTSLSGGIETFSCFRWINKLILLCQTSIRLIFFQADLLCPKLLQECGRC